MIYKLLVTVVVSMFFSFYLLAQVDTNCESQCKREYDSAKWECSRKYPGSLEKKYYENCMLMNENNYQRCISTCGY